VFFFFFFFCFGHFGHFGHFWNFGIFDRDLIVIFFGGFSTEQMQKEKSTRVAMKKIDKKKYFFFFSQTIDLLDPSKSQKKSFVFFLQKFTKTGKIAPNRHFSGTKMTPEADFDLIKL
jgi:hypothetical protein